MAVIDQERLRTAVIGCGLIGTRRAAETSLHSRTRLLLCIDTSHAPARNTAERYGAAWSTDWRIAIEDDRMDAIVVCTPNASAHDIVIAALERGKHVLVEKPMGCDLAQAEAVAAVARRSTGCFKVGVNHRYHPAVSRAHELVELGEIGEITSMRAQLSGGGDPLDRVANLSDLIAWFAGLPSQAFADVQTAVPVEDTAFGLLRYDSGAVASLHTSWTQSKNLFSLEVVGRDGSISVDGLGGSFGTERITAARRNSVREEAFDGPDRSWAIEWHQFVDAIERGTPYWGTAGDGLAAMRIVNALYRSSSDGIAVPV